MGISTLLPVVLGGRIGCNVAVLGCRDPRVRALFGCGVGCGSRARVAAAIQSDVVGRIQFLDVRRTDRTLEAATEANVIKWRPLQTELVGVGRESEAVVREPVAAIQRQSLHERLVLDQRGAEFDEFLTDAVGPRGGQDDSRSGHIAIDV